MPKELLVHILLRITTIALKRHAGSGQVVAESNTSVLCAILFQLYKKLHVIPTQKVSNSDLYKPK